MKALWLWHFVLVLTCFEKHRDMICTRTLTIDPPGTHSLLGIDILMRCNLDIDRSLCFPTAIQSKSATSTYKDRSSSWDRGGAPPVQGQFQCRLETWFEMHILKESHHLAQHPFLFNSKFESQIQKLKKQLILIQFPMHGANADWSPRMGTYRTGISSSAACYKYLLEDSGRQKFLWIMNLLRLMDNNNKVGKLFQKMLSKWKWIISDERYPSKEMAWFAYLYS